MNRLKWNNLKQNRCPKCGSGISYDDKYAICQCGFRIGLEKMNEIVTNRVANDIDSKRFGK